MNPPGRTTPPAATPAAAPAPAARSEPFPDGSDGIPWPDAVALIENGRVRAVYQTHSLDVRLDTLDGETFYTREPAVDEVLRLVDESAPNGDTIIKATE